MDCLQCKNLSSAGIFLNVPPFFRRWSKWLCLFLVISLPSEDTIVYVFEFAATCEGINLLFSWMMHLSAMFEEMKTEKKKKKTSLYLDEGKIRH